MQLDMACVAHVVGVALLVFCVGACWITVHCVFPLLQGGKASDAGSEDGDSVSSTPSLFERLYTDHKRVEEVLEQKRQELKAAELKGCTFKPKTNTISRRRSGGDPEVRAVLCCVVFLYCLHVFCCRFHLYVPCRRNQLFMSCSVLAWPCLSWCVACVFV